MTSPTPTLVPAADPEVELDAGRDMPLPASTDAVATMHGTAATLSAGTPGHSTGEDMILDDLLVEEISIDGMCGVY